MARSIVTIQAEIIANVQSDAVLGAGLTSTSSTAQWRLWTRIVATAIWTMEVLFDVFTAETLALVAAQKAHTVRWYQTKALAFQLGYTLIPNGDTYDNTGFDEDEIADSKIIAQAAAVEFGDILIIKVAQLLGGDLEPLSVGDTTAVTAYFQEIKDAGVKILVRSVEADHLRVVVDVYYDATIFDDAGARLDGTAATPVQDSVYAFLRTLPFDGQFIKAHLTDAMQAVQGVIVPEIRTCLARRDDDPTFGSVDVFYQPYSGFLKVYDPMTDLVLNFIAA